MVLITSENDFTLQEEVTRITKNTEVATLNQVSSARFIENHIDEETRWIHFKLLENVTVALFNLIQSSHITIKSGKRIKMPKIIITSNRLLKKDFNNIDMIDLIIKEKGRRTNR